MAKPEELVVENLLVDIDETFNDLDDAEFDLPNVEAPTLESILNESADEDVDPLAADTEFAGLLGSFDTESLNSFDNPDRRRKRKIYAGHGSVMRHTILKGISAQIVSAHNRINAGLPTAMAVDKFVAVGTAHGIVYIFEPSQAIKWSLGSFAVGVQYGSVCSICFNTDCTRMLVGFAKGQITMWDLTNGKLLRTITDAHPAGQAVLHVKFTDSLTTALCSDSGGSVFELEFTRGVKGRGCISRCLFSGSHGEVCAFEPLHMPITAKGHQIGEMMLVAMVSFTKVMVVTVRPEVKIVFSWPVSGSPDTLPLLSWCFVSIRVHESDSVYDPVLAVARQSTFHFFQAVVKKSQAVQFHKLQTSEVSYVMVSFCWLNSRTLAVLDKSEKLHILDVKSWEELEVIDMSDMMFVYSTSMFKGLATGGNVSPALSCAGEEACYYSMSSYHSQLFTLGNKSVHVMTIRTWQERLDVLLKENRHQDAIALALSFHDGTAKAVVGLPTDSNKRKQIVSDKMMDILYTYVDLSMTKLCPEYGKIDELIKHYENVVPICVEYCLHLNRVAVLFGRLYDRFSQDVIANGAFLECLEPYILDDKLRTISPQIIKDFTLHFQAKGLLSRVESCIVHLDIISLDLHETVKLCWEKCMYDAIIYIYNRGLRDFVTPMEELTNLLKSAMRSGKQLTDDEIRLGNKLLVYISNSLAGLAYPNGTLPEELVPVVKSDMYRTLTAIHSSSAGVEEKVYPYLRIFLEFDTREFLNVLALAFEEEEFGTSDGYQQRQRVVDILLQVMVEDSDFNPTQVGILFTFLARQIARHSGSIQLNRHLFEQVLEYLCRPGDVSHKEERQEALLELLTVNDILHIDQTKLLAMAEHANMYRVSEFIYKKQQLYDKILLCYINDTSRRHQAFEFIEQTLRNNSEKVYQQIRSVTLQHLVPLIECDSQQTARLVLDVLKADLTEIVSLLDKNADAQYQLLQGIILFRESMDSQSLLEHSIYEKYIERMCQFDSRSVEHYLKTSDGYREEEAYQICSKHRMYDAMSYLLEKMGRVQDAFNMVMKTFQQKIDVFEELITDSRASKHINNVEVVSQQLQSMLLKLIGLCQRNSAKLTEEQREKLWFPLLDSVLEPQQKLSLENLHSHVFKEACRQVMNCMMGYIELPAMMSKIIKDFTISQGKFGDVKDLVMGMLNTYNYEKTLMKTCSNMLNHDLVSQLGERLQVSARAFVPNHDKCGYCNRRLTSSSDSQELIVFRCGHLFHGTCLERSGTFYYSHETNGGVVQWACYLCNQTQASLSPTMAKKAVSAMNLASAAKEQTEEEDYSRICSVTSGHHIPLDSQTLRLRLTPPSLLDNDLMEDT